MRISRPCYDKMHRCPGWAGGGMTYAKIDRCEAGYLRRWHIRRVEGYDGDIFAGRMWRFRINRCPVCGVYVLPHVVRWVDPGWWHHWRPGWWHHR